MLVPERVWVAYGAHAGQRAASVALVPSPGHLEYVRAAKLQALVEAVKKHAMGEYGDITLIKTIMDEAGVGKW